MSKEAYIATICNLIINNYFDEPEKAALEMATFLAQACREVYPEESYLNGSLARIRADYLERFRDAFSKAIKEICNAELRNKK